MAYIRDRKQEKTGYQSMEPNMGKVDNACDFVMCYRTTPDLPERIKQYREQGYVVHYMTGISWGAYEDYLYGEYDGHDHWDEAQTDRFGNRILHSPTRPYMVPSVEMSDYITEQLKNVIDLGVEAIHVEEPEFWDRGGYSEAFKREYKIYYGEDWADPNDSFDAMYRCAKLKAFLYQRTITRVSQAVKEYALKKYNKAIRFYVPTHSLLNYTQWKIISPEGKIADINSVDGCIAQVWTGTSREKNWYNGEFKERTFETAYLEYGVMQELVSGTGKKMWFLHDPIEDNPIFDWTDYRLNYLKTVTASLLHPGISDYEICPWPIRVFTGAYPSNSPNAETIPPEYAVILNNNFNTLGDIECAPDSISPRVGVLCADSQLYQRTYPDFGKAADARVGTVLRDTDEDLAAFRNELFAGNDKDGEILGKYVCSAAFPSFFGLAMPILKYGMPIRPVLLDNARRYSGYLDNYDILVLSYEFMKPEYPDINNVLAEWVKSGGTLIYVGNGNDPFNGIRSWWTGKFNNPAEHLFMMAGVENTDDEAIYKCGKGVFAIYNRHPAAFTYSKENADAYRAFFKKVIEEKGYEWTYGNVLYQSRPPYITAAVLDESVTDDDKVFTGLYTDMYTANFDVIEQKVLHPGEDTLLFDYDEIENESFRIIGTSVRILSADVNENTVTLKTLGAELKDARIRVRVPGKVSRVTLDGNVADHEYDERSRTVLIKFDNVTGEREFKIVM